MNYNCLEASTKSSGITPPNIWSGQCRPEPVDANEFGCRTTLADAVSFQHRHSVRRQVAIITSQFIKGSRRTYHFLTSVARQPQWNREGSDGQVTTRQWQWWRFMGIPCAETIEGTRCVFKISILLHIDQAENAETTCASPCSNFRFYLLRWKTNPIFDLETDKIRKIILEVSQCTDDTS